MQTKNETDQDVDYMQNGGGGGGDDREGRRSADDEPKLGRIERFGGMSGHFQPRGDRPWRVTFGNPVTDPGKSITSDEICDRDALVTLVLKEGDWAVEITTDDPLRMAS